MVTIGQHKRRLLFSSGLGFFTGPVEPKKGDIHHDGTERAIIDLLWYEMSMELLFPRPGVL